MWCQKDPKSNQKGTTRTKRAPKGPNMDPKGGQKEPKVTQRGAKGRQRDAKRGSKIHKNNIKNRYLEKGRFWGPKGGVRATSFGPIFDLFLVQKCVQKSMRKKVPKKASNISKNKQKTRYDSILINAFSHICCAKAVPSK